MRVGFEIFFKYFDQRNFSFSLLDILISNMGLFRFFFFKYFDGGIFFFLCCKILISNASFEIFF